MVIDILRTIDPVLFKYCYDSLRESKLVTWINFMALFPINLCPRQTIRELARDLITTWVTPLKKAREYSQLHAGEAAEEEDDDNGGKPRKE